MLADGFIAGLYARNGLFLYDFPGFPGFFNGRNQPFARVRYFLFGDMRGGNQQCLCVFQQMVSIFGVIGFMVGYIIFHAFVLVSVFFDFLTIAVFMPT